MSVSFVQPFVLLALLLLPLVAWSGIARLRGDRLGLATMLLRCLAVASLVLALAQPVIQLRSRSASVVFLLDASDSVSPADRQAAVELVKAAQSAAPSDAATGVVVFGSQAIVEQEPRPGASLDAVTSSVDGSATDIAGAVRLGTALFPPGASRRLVLVSDGRSTTSTTEDAVQAAVEADTPVDVLAIGSPRQGDAVVQSLDAPPSVRLGQAIELRARVSSHTAGDASLHILGDGRLLVEQKVALQPGANEFTVTLPAQPRGFHRWQARLEFPGDTEQRNNGVDAFTQVESAPRVLLAENTPGEGAALEAALHSTGLEVDRVRAVELPSTLANLGQYAAVVLVDVPLSAIPDKGTLLQQYVHDLGRGLVTVGGDESYALGAYFDSPLEQALPVESRLRNRKDEPAVALVMAIDKSGSMAVCHCSENGGADPPGSTPKVDIAKEAAIRSAEVLGPEDEFGVLAFDTAARWVVRTAPLKDKATVESNVADIQGSGGTNIYGGLAEAINSLKQSRAPVKHVVLLTDGWSNVGNYDALLEEARAAGITVSTVSAGGGSPDLLRSIAENANGVFYQPKDSRDIPEILVREAQSRLRRYVQEEEFTPAVAAPSAILKDIDAMPPLLGYINTTAKSTATVPLVTPGRDPLLAQWQYGLGRSVSWTSDANTRWSRSWIGTPQFRRLFSQAVDWARGRPSSGLEAQVRTENGSVRVEVEARTPGGSYLNGAAGTAEVFAPDGSSQRHTLTQTAPGHYTAEVQAGKPGAYLAAVSLNTGREVLRAAPLGFGVGYSPEYRDSGPDASALSVLAARTGGSLLAAPADVFRRPVRQGHTYHYLWRPLLLLALLLLPVEIALRRVRALPAARDVAAALPSALRVELRRRNTSRSTPGRSGPAAQLDSKAERLRAAKLRASAAYVPGPEEGNDAAGH